MEVQTTEGGSQNQTDGEMDSHVIRVASKCSFSMEQRFKQQPILLRPSAGEPSCCIFKAPRRLVQINEKAYEPHIVSIGPYHHGQERLNMVEQHKPRFLSALLQRTKNSGVGLDTYFTAIASREKDIRNYYSELLLCESSALVEMMLLDACFIVEVFRIFGRVFMPVKNDPFFATPWMFTFIMRDLLQMENQIPFFVLEKVFNLSKGETADQHSTCSLIELTLKFFNSAVEMPQKHLENFYRVSKVKHLLDLFRRVFIGHSELEQTGHGNSDPVRLLPSATQLRELEPTGHGNSDPARLLPSATQLLRSGIKFEPRKGDNSNFLDIQFNHGVLKIPTLTLDDFISSFLLNCVAFEQCCQNSNCNMYVTSYIAFMRCLVSAEMDAQLLSEKQILVNYLGSNAEVAAFFNNIFKDIAFDIKSSYLAELLGQVNKHHRNGCNLFWAGTKRKYFGSPWSAISAFAASVLLGLTILQATYAVYAYYRPPK